MKSFYGKFVFYITDIYVLYTIFVLISSHSHVCTRVSHEFAATPMATSRARDTPPLQSHQATDPTVLNKIILYYSSAA